MQSTSRRTSVVSVVLCLTTSGMSACADGGPTGPREAAVEAPTTVRGTAVPGPGGLEGLKQDIAMFRAIAADPVLRERIVIATTGASQVSVEELIAFLESGVLLASSQSAREPDAVRLLGEYYSSNVSPAASISFIPSDMYNYRTDYWGATSCRNFSSMTTAGVRATMRANSNRQGEWFVLRDYWLAPNTTGYNSGHYYLHVGPDRAGTNYYNMNTRHYCADGWDTWYVDLNGVSGTYSH